MAVKSRRRAREAAMRSLYEIELAHGAPDAALESAFEEFELSEDQSFFARRVVMGVLEHMAEIDNGLAKLIRDYDFDRIAAVDRNVLRVAAYELMFEPAIPPAVTINEAIEIAKRYSTAESGRFVNGVLGKFVLGTSKASWDPSAAPAEETEERFSEQEFVAEVELVEPESEEARTAQKLGAWTLREP